VLAVLAMSAAGCSPDGAASGGSGGADSTTSSTREASSTTSTSESTSSTVAAPSADATSTTATTIAAFRSSVSTVTAADLGASWHPGCPVEPAGLRAIDLTYWGDDDQAHEGRLIVANDEVEHVVEAFRLLYEGRFPIHRLEPVDHFGADDEASMRANNTSAFNCRTVAGTSRWSEHAFGRAVDLNPLVNPYVRQGSVDPPEGAAYADRSRTDPGLIHDGDVAVMAFAAQGWGWGGHWRSGQDHQHFSASGR
jgi:hypothetical protein